MRFSTFDNLFIKKIWKKLQEAQAYADENGNLFMETSAKTAANVNELFVAIGTDEHWCLSTV